MSHTYENTTGHITLPATAVALTLGVRVKLDSSGNVSAASATDRWIGVTTAPCVASGNAAIKLRGTDGTLDFAAAGAIAAGAVLYGAASGQVDDAQTAGPAMGYMAKHAVSAAGDIVEAVPVSDSPALTVLAFQVTLANVTAADVVTAFPLTFAGAITAFDFIQGTPVTTAAKLASLNTKLNSTDVTGGVIALTSAACTPLGKVISGTAITALNTFASGDTLTIKATSVTAFVEGAGTMLVTCVRN